MSVVDPPKSILKKKSQFDREVDTYLRVKSVKSIRFSLDSNKTSRKNSPTDSKVSLDPKITKNNQRKSEKKRRRRNEANANVGEDAEKSHKQEKTRKPKKSFLEGHGDEKEKPQNEQNDEETQPEENIGDTLIKPCDKIKGEEIEEMTKEENEKKEEETVEKVKKKRRRRRRRKHKRQPKE